MLAASNVRLDTNALDFAILGTYFLVVLGVGFAARRYVKTSLGLLLEWPLAAGVDHGACTTPAAGAG
jgi:hypothetical protein